MKQPRSSAQIATGKFIVDCEARRNSAGQITVYRLPPADGGGTIEVAGINDRYHPEQAKKLAGLISEGKSYAAEVAAVSYILDYTDVVQGWHPSAAVEAFLRDTAFNRGPRGAAKIYQRAVGCRIDGVVGEITKASGELIAAPQLLLALRRARESYELEIAPPVGARRKFWTGLVNRWDRALKFAQGLL